MTKSTIVLFICGAAVAFGLAMWMHSLAPQGILLYTPAPNTKPNYTPSSLVGFFIAMLALSTISALVAILGIFISVLFNSRFFVVAKQATFLLVGFGSLLTLAIFTEKFWP